MKYTAFCCLTFIFCAQAFCQTDEKGIVLGIERSAADAFTKHNVVFLTAAYADNAQLTSATGTVITKQQLIQSVERMTSCALSEMQVRIEGNVAIVTGLATISGKDDNGNYLNKNRFTDVLLKTKGQWQIIASQATPVGQ